MDFRDEFIGSKVSVSGREVIGKIVDETKNTFVIKIGNKTKRFAKKGNVFDFMIGNKIATIEGEKLVMRPEDRIKILGGVNEKKYRD